MNTYLQWARNNSRSIGAVLGGSVLSSGITALVVLKRAELKYRKIADEEIESVKETFARQRKVGEYATPEDAVRALGREPVEPEAADQATLEAMETYSKALGDNRVITLDDMKGIVERAEEDKQKVAYNSIFAKDEDNGGWDLERQLELRVGQVRYPISYEEFTANETEFQQVEVTYFEGDDVLVDDQDDVIVDQLDFLGTNQIQFGFGSNDPNIAYIRNEDIDTDILVVRSNNTYSDVVHGVALRHSADVPRKFRWSDE